MKKIILFITFIILVFIIIVVQKSTFQSIINQKTNMKLTSPVIKNNETIPSKYTCEGDGASPELDITDIPEGSQSLALILKDPDSPVSPFIHWVVWNISPGTSVIHENSSPDGSVVGINSINKNFYFAPCPQQGQHHYIYYLYALNTTLTLPPEAGAPELEQIIIGHVLGVTTLTGIFP